MKQNSGIFYLIGRFSAILLTMILLALCVVLPASAEDGNHPDRVVDDADLLSDAEEATLRERLNEISTRLDFDVVVVTTSDLDGKSPMAYADDYYNYGGYGMGKNSDGILFLRYINGNEKEVWISTCGSGIRYFSDSDIDYLFDCMASDIRSDRYASALATFADKVDSEVQDARAYKLYWIPVGLVIGLLVGLIVTGCMKSSLKSVASRPYAGDYVRKGSFNLTRNKDTYLYRTVSRTPIPKSTSGSSSTHTSSSGRSHGGGGRSI